MGRPRGKAVKLEGRRQEAMDLIEVEGLSAAEAARKLKIHDRTIRKWLSSYRKHGAEGLTVRVSTGRPLKLTAKNLEKLQKILLAGPIKSGFPNDLWTSRGVLKVIESKFSTKYHANHLPKLLRSMGFTPQRPQREAAEKGREQIGKWIRYSWTRIKKKPGPKKPPLSS